eukprot:COSAG04_NODE_1645_length_6065_cov_12.892558_6_plen_336_part_00
MPHARREGRRPECRRAAAAAVLGLTLALLAPAARAQVTTSGSEDGAVLVEAAAAADTSACSDGFGDGGPCPTVSWLPGTMVCGDGWDSYHEGWVRVECDTAHGRVVRVYLSSTGIGGALLQYFGRLGALVYLALDDNRRLRGNLAELAGATNLRMLHMADCPNVVGDVAALSVLVHLGGQITMPCDAPSDATCPWDAAFTYSDCCASSAFALSGGASCGNDGPPHPRIPFLHLQECLVDFPELTCFACAGPRSTERDAEGAAVVDETTTFINCCATGELGWCQRPLDENGDPISSTPCDVIPDGATTSVKINRLPTTSLAGLRFHTDAPLCCRAA